MGVAAVVEIGVGGMDRRTHPGKEDKPIGASAGGTLKQLRKRGIWPLIPTIVTTVLTAWFESPLLGQR